MLPISDGELKRSTFPYVNVGLIALCAIVFIYEQLISDQSLLIFFTEYGLIPAELAHGVDLADRYSDVDNPVPTWATMFTSMFIHGDWMHFLFNMLFLWIFGDNVEDRFGHVKYLFFYLLCGVAASWLQIATDTHSEIPTIGASGAIAGVLGAYLFLFPYSRINTLVIFIFITAIRIPAYLILGFWFLMQFVSGVGSLGPESQSGGVAYWAHIGGFLAGAAVVVLYRFWKGEPLWPRGPGASGGGSGGYSGYGREREAKYWRGRRIDY